MSGGIDIHDNRTPSADLVERERFGAPRVQKPGAQVHPPVVVVAAQRHREAAPADVGRMEWSVNRFALGPRT
jgi:hypothetical protein